MIGALIGGYIAAWFEPGSLATVHIGALGMAIAGALLMLLVTAQLHIQEKRCHWKTPPTTSNWPLI